MEKYSKLMKFLRGGDTSSASKVFKEKD